jgi:hypothetical protein
VHVLGGPQGPFRHLAVRKRWIVEWVDTMEAVPEYNRERAGARPIFNDFGDLIAGS